MNQHQRKIPFVVSMMGSLLIGLGATTVSATEPGINPDWIRVGGVMDLEGHSRGLGLGMRAGIEAAFSGERVQGKRIEFVTLNDSYSPELTVRQTRKLLDQGVFAMVGNVGTPTAQQALPILDEYNVPAFGFFTGAGLLRTGKEGVINYRASYIQETAAVIDSAIQAGLRPAEVCAYVQNDAYGMAGVEGIKRALRSQPGTGKIIEKLDDILAQSGDAPSRNGIGPVGVYERNTLSSSDGYQSLKKWETANESKCRLVVTVGAYPAIGRFAAYARGKGDNWLISAVSFTGTENLGETLDQFGVRDRVIVTQVVPPLDADLPILNDARKALGAQYNYVSLEGYIVGKLFLAIMNRVEGDITRAKFVQEARNSQFDLGGLLMDLTGDNQASDLVSVTYFQDKAFQPMDAGLWSRML
ncbi:ABC transporter substrate-binding protein [Allohahella sp. A8]|uniref:ABC transporter substrate-binding protein n=1 Tax=Allohahella sp. A8 TaxID=3141461 RepID=UPI003A7F6A93